MKAETEDRRTPWDIGERTLAYGVWAVRLHHALAEMKDGAAVRASGAVARA